MASNNNSSNNSTYNNMSNSSQASDRKLPDVETASVSSYGSSLMKPEKGKQTSGSSGSTTKTWDSKLVFDQGRFFSI